MSFLTIDGGTIPQFPKLVKGWLDTFVYLPYFKLKMVEKLPDKCHFCNVRFCRAVVAQGRKRARCPVTLDRMGLIC